MGCKLWTTAEQWPRFNVSSLTNEKRGDAVIFGKPFLVPDLRFQFEKDGNVIRPNKVAVAYGWNWLEYPYPEHSFGAWSSAGDTFECNVGKDGKLTVPSFTVKPRGWYKGFYTYFPWPKKPFFDSVEVTVHLAGCAPKLRIGADDLKQYTQALAVVKVSCTAPIEVAFRK